jgi:hypothetical protein
MELEEPELRSWLIRCRNDLESVLGIFPEGKEEGLMGKAIDWIF